MMALTDTKDTFFILIKIYYHNDNNKVCSCISDGTKPQYW